MSRVWASRAIAAHEPWLDEVARTDPAGRTDPASHFPAAGLAATEFRPDRERPAVVARPAASHRRMPVAAIMLSVVLLAGAGTGLALWQRGQDRSSASPPATAAAQRSTASTATASTAARSANPPHRSGAQPAAHPARPGVDSVVGAAARATPGDVAGAGAAAPADVGATAHTARTSTAHVGIRLHAERVRRTRVLRAERRAPVRLRPQDRLVRGGGAVQRAPTSAGRATS